jgi:hypothetical protein
MSCLPCQENNPETNPDCTPAPCETQPCTEKFEGRCVDLDVEIPGLPCLIPGQTNLEDFIRCLFSVDGVKKIINIINQSNELRYSFCQIVGSCGLIPVTTSTTSSTTTTSTSSTTTTTTAVPEYLVFQVVNNSGNNVDVDLLVQTSNFSTTYLLRNNWIPVTSNNETTELHISDAGYLYIDNNAILPVTVQIHYSQDNGGSFFLLQTLNLSALGQSGSTAAIMSLPIPRDAGANGNNILKFTFTAQAVTTTTTVACTGPTDISFEHVTCEPPTDVVVNVSI